MAGATTKDWPWDQGRNVVTVTTWQVIRGEAPVTVVIHYSEDHSWAFLGGAPFSFSDAALITMAEAVGRDASLAEIADLQPGWVATRERVGGPWKCEFDPEM